MDFLSLLPKEIFSFLEASWYLVNDFYQLPRFTNFLKCLETICFENDVFSIYRFGVRILNLALCQPAEKDNLSVPWLVTYKQSHLPQTFFRFVFSVFIAIINTSHSYEENLIMDSAQIIILSGFGLLVNCYLIPLCFTQGFLFPSFTCNSKDSILER